MNKIAQCKKSANGPLQFMQKYIDKKKYPEEIRLACLQWAQAYRDEYGKTCDEVLTSGDLLVILPGMTVCVCMTLKLCNRLILILHVFVIPLSCRREAFGRHSSWYFERMGNIRKC